MPGVEIKQCNGFRSYKIAVPKSPSVQKSVKQFTYNFVFMLLTLWSKLTGEVHAFSRFGPFWRKFTAYLFSKHSDLSF